MVDMVRKGSKGHDRLDEANLLLADPTRFQIYRMVIGAGGEGATTADVAERFGLHRNVARMHLQKLAGAGMLAVSQRRSPGGGRPERVYRLGDTVACPYPPRDYELLADITLTALEDGGDPRRIARKLGRQAGERALAASGIDPATAPRKRLLESITALAEAHGIFANIAVDADGHIDVTALNCVFKELAARHARLICGLHTQLLLGMFESHFGKVRIRKGKPDIAEGGMSCQFRVTSAS